jgi:hypothetical protein
MQHEKKRAGENLRPELFVRFFRKIENLDLHWHLVQCRDRYYLLHTPFLQMPVRFPYLQYAPSKGGYTQPINGSQWSGCVQMLLSSQTTVLNSHAPVVVLQESVVQALLSLQILTVPMHAPFVQTSPEVQALLSLQVVPLVTAVPWQT